MSKHGLSLISFVLASGVLLLPACGGDDDGTSTGPDGSAGASGSAGAAGGGKGGTGGSGGTAGGGGTGGSSGSQDAGVDARVPCGSTTCNPNGTNRYCNPAGPEGPRCQACLTDEHCANNTQRPYCDVAAGSCRSCLNDSHCTPPNRCIAGTLNNTCQLRCASDADCAGAAANRRACNLTTMMCVECQTNVHCAGSTSGPVCVGNNCEQCGTDVDCTAPGLPACINNACEACRDNAQCAEPTPICVTRGANTCRECGVDADCAGRAGGPACVSNTCRACSATIPCPTGNTCSSNTCVPIPEGGAPDTGNDASNADSSDGDGPLDATFDDGNAGEASVFDAPPPDTTADMSEATAPDTGSSADAADDG